MMGDEHVPSYEVEPSLDPKLPAASNKKKIIGYRIRYLIQSVDKASIALSSIFDDCGCWKTSLTTRFALLHRTRDMSIYWQ